MKSVVPAIVAVLVCCGSCVEVNPELGKNLLPVWESGSFHSTEVSLGEVDIRMADSLSGFSDSRIVIGSINEPTFGVVEKRSVVNLVPLFKKGDTLDLATFLDSASFRVKSFHLCVAADTTSWALSSQAPILQNVYVNPLLSPIDPETDYDCNDVAGKIKVDKGRSIIKGTPVINGTDSLSFDFTEEYAMEYVRGMDKAAASDFSEYNKRFPGFCISTDPAKSEGGRIDMFKLQLGFDQSSGLTGNLAHLSLSYIPAAEASKGEAARKDTSFTFYLGVDDFYDVDSLFTNSATGSFPQHALNLSTHGSRSKAAGAGNEILVEGGGGLKPVVRAVYLRETARQIIRDSARVVYGREPSEEEMSAVIINKARLTFPFEYEDAMYETMYQYPARLSPVCRIHSKDDTNLVTYASLTDNSDENENQGDIDRHNLAYSPDITYHLREIIGMREGSDKMKSLLAGDYDVWLLCMANETVTTTSSSDSDMSEYYQYLAYQNYYNSMYGGYGGYGYGGYGYGDSYSNYYSYMMASMYASGSQTTTSSLMKLDPNRYYRAVLNGPSFAGRRPTLTISFTIPEVGE